MYVIFTLQVHLRVYLVPEHWQKVGLSSEWIQTRTHNLRISRCEYFLRGRKVATETGTVALGKDRQVKVTFAAMCCIPTVGQMTQQNDTTNDTDPVKMGCWSTKVIGMCFFESEWVEKQTFLLFKS